MANFDIFFILKSLLNFKNFQPFFSITSICENYGISSSLQILLSKNSLRELKFDTVIKSERSVLWKIHVKCKIELKVLHFRIKRWKFSWHPLKVSHFCYLIKRYKDSEEFYRFVPKSNIPQTSYRGELWLWLSENLMNFCIALTVDGVKVDVSI